MAISPAIVANTAPTCGIVILACIHLQASKEAYTHSNIYVDATELLNLSVQLAANMYTKLPVYSACPLTDVNEGDTI